ncbi:response regulator [Desulfoplanes sp.]
MIDRHGPVLVVEDIVPARQTVVNILRVLGFSKVMEAGNGREAWDVIRNVEETLGLVISDWKMPVMSGMDLLKRVRSHPPTSMVPFLLLTSRAEPGDLALAADAGVSDYLIKPLVISALEEKLALLDRCRAVGGSDACRHLETLVGAEETEEARRFLGQIARELGARARAVVLYGEALLAWKSKRWETAREDIDACLEQAPLMSRGWYLRALVLSGMGDGAGASASLDKAMEISPENVDYVLSKGRFEMGQGRYPEANQWFMTALNMEPRNRELKERVWSIYLQEGAVERVLREYTPYIFSSLSSDALNATALALRKKDKVTAAVKIYIQALRKDPENIKLLFNLAMAEVHNSDIRGATNHLKRAIALKPDFTSACEMLERLESKNPDASSG